MGGAQQESGVTVCSEESGVTVCSEESGVAVCSEESGVAVCSEVIGRTASAAEHALRARAIPAGSSLVFDAARFGRRPPKVQAVELAGFNLRASVYLGATEAQGRERLLCRHMSRTPYPQKPMIDDDVRRQVGFALLAFAFVRHELHRSAVEGAVRAINQNVAREHEIRLAWVGDRSDFRGLSVERSIDGKEYGALFPWPLPTDPTLKAAVLITKLITSSLLTGDSHERGLYLRSHFCVGNETLNSPEQFEEMTKYAEIIYYAGRFDYEQKRLAGLTLLGPSIVHGNEMAFQWRRHLSALARSQEDAWKMVTTRAGRSGLEFLIGEEPLIEVLERALDQGGPLACTGFVIAREMLRWFPSVSR